MDTYPVDIDPRQIVHWVMAETSAAPGRFRVSARRSVEQRWIPFGAESRLGDEEREDLSEIATVATLEIAPLHASEGWLLTVEVEDELGPRVVEEESIEDDKEIDLDTFYKDFIRPGRGNASATAEVNGPEAEQRLASLLATIEKDRHGPGGARRTGRPHR